MSTGCFLVLATLAFLCEYVDSTLGMGYGTTLSPLLVILGLDPRVVVSGILFSEFLTGVAAGIFHHEFGNVDFNPTSTDLRVALVLAACSILGAAAAVIISLSLPPKVIKLYIGLLVASMGLMILSGYRGTGRFSWAKILALGAVASFNKAVSGGGYGPLIVSGQVLAGVDGKRAVGITALAEGMTCLTGLLLYAMLGREMFDAWVWGALAIGAMLSTPLSAYSVNRLHKEALERFIGMLTLALGALTLAKALLCA